MDYTDFAHGRDSGFGGFDHDLGQVAAFGDLQAGLIGPVPKEGIEALPAAVGARAEVPTAHLAAQ